MKTWRVVRQTFGTILVSIAIVLTNAGPAVGSDQIHAVAGKTIVFVCGENEYNTAESLARFAERELAPRGYVVAWVNASPKEGDSDFKNYYAITNADLLVLSVRRRTPPRAMVKLIEAHLAADRPLVGIRTASHAFDAVPPDDQHQSWAKFDQEILGAEYQGHNGNSSPTSPTTLLRLVQSNAFPALLAGVDLSFRATSHLYKYRNLAPTVTVLVQGSVEGRQEAEPVAWVNMRAGRRVFYISLGSPEDFKLRPFRQILLNGIRWSLGDSDSRGSTPVEDRSGILSNNTW